MDRFKSFIWKLNYDMDSYELKVILGIALIILSVIFLFIEIIHYVNVSHHVMSEINGSSLVVGNAYILGTRGLSISLSAYLGSVTINRIVVYGLNNETLLSLPGRLPSGCSLTIYNSTGTFNSWGMQVLGNGKGLTINIECEAGMLYTATKIEVIYNGNETTTIYPT